MRQQKTGNTTALLIPGRIPDALDLLGIDYMVHGDEATALCPAHEDRHPSWSVNTATGMHHCFSCGFGGPFSRLVEAVLNISRREAEQWVLRRAAGSSAPATAIREKAPQVGESDLVFFVPPPAAELARRNISAESCAALGIMWDGTKDCWVLPIRDPQTNALLGWQEKYGDGLVRNRPRSVVKHRSVFGVREVPNGPLVVVESPLDVARLRTAGYDTGVSTYGVQASCEQLQVIRYARGRDILFALDNDQAGRKMSRELHQLCPLLTSANVRYFNYDAAGRYVKDIGDMTDEEIKRGIEYSLDECHMQWQDWEWDYQEDTCRTGAALMSR